MAAEQFSPDSVKILGDIEYGQTSQPLDCPETPRYCALLFNGHTGDKVDVIVKSAKGKAFVALADGTLTEITRGVNHLVFTLHDASPDLITYYIVFGDSDGKAAQFTVGLKKVATPRHASALRRNAFRAATAWSGLLPRTAAPPATHHAPGKGR